MGLPHFSTRRQLITNPIWSQYFINVYGEIPIDDYPLCIADFQLLYRTLLRKLGYQLPMKYHGCPESIRYETRRYWEENTEPPWTDTLLIPLVHSLHVQKNSIPPFHWTEVRHRSKRSERVGMWFAVATGSGIWFNVGRTIVFRTHDEAFRYFNVNSGNENAIAYAAKARGYDTIQFTECDGVATSCCNKLRLPARCFNLEFVATALSGLSACGGGMFRQGWNATRVCHCDETLWGSSAASDEPRVRYTHCKKKAQTVSMLI